MKAKGSEQMSKDLLKEAQCRHGNKGGNCKEGGVRGRRRGAGAVITDDCRYDEP